MKLLTSCLVLLLTASLTSADDVQAGPNGGRLITAVVPHAEFFVMPDRHVQITFWDEAGSQVTPGEQTVKITTGQRSAPTTLTFVESNGVLRSDGRVPDGNDFPTVVQIKPSPDAKTVVERFYLNTIVCSGCNNAEYACICGH